MHMEKWTTKNSSSVNRPLHKGSLYSASQGLQQQPWNVSQQKRHQATLHPYQQMPHLRQYIHVRQHYDLYSSTWKLQINILPKTQRNTRLISFKSLNGYHSPTVTLSPIIVGKTFPARLDLATWTRELSCMFVPDPILMLLTSPA